MDLITHFSHRHKLALVSSCKNEFWSCKICLQWSNDEGNDEFYTCSQGCQYNVHRLCAEFPEKKTHPFHPHHTLVFRTSYEDEEYGYRMSGCSFCRKSTSKAFSYHCEECHFVLDPRCAALTPIQAKPPMNMIHHQHPVLECVKPDVYYFRYRCQGCGEKLEHYDNVFVCIECNTLLHEICASLPDEIIHPFHLQHPLTLQIPEGLHGPNICHACQGPDQLSLRYEHKVYRCSSCKFTLDVHCASLKPTDDQLKEHKKVITPSHPHPLIQCDIIKNFRRRCFGCEIAFDGFIYACLDCSILLNKSCVDLPADITHPFHPQHPLRLGTGRPPWGCTGCCKQTSEFFYSCGECKFVLDLKCATKSFQFVKLELHNHGLAYFDFEADGGLCHRCEGLCTKYFFRCIDCNFSIHDHCCPSLPHAIKHPCHFHSLIFTLEWIQDAPHEDILGEYYCHACEELRELIRPTYYCAECHFIAHVHCVISEILSFSETEPVLLVDKARREEDQDFGFVEYEEWDNEAEQTSDRGGNHTRIQFKDDQHKSKDQVHGKQNVQEQSKEEDDGTHAYDTDAWERSTDESDPKEDKDNQAANKERMLQDIDEQINSLKAELAKLLRRRAQLVAGK